MDGARVREWVLAREIMVNVDQRCLWRCRRDAPTDGGASSLFERAVQFLRIIASFSKSALYAAAAGKPLAGISSCVPWGYLAKLNIDAINLHFCAPGRAGWASLAASCAKERAALG